MAERLTLAAKTALQKAIEHRYHQRHRREALGLLHSIESQSGKTDPALLRKASDYAGDVFGGRDYAPWLHVYTAIAGKFREGWIPDNFYGLFVVPRINGWHGKTAGVRALGKAFFSHFPDVAYKANGLLVDSDYRVLGGPAALREHLAAHERIVFKEDFSVQGEGVRFLRVDALDDARIAALGNGVFQQAVVQHEAFEPISPGAVATLRLTTLVEDDGTISLRGSILRLGREGETHVQDRSEATVPIDPATGVLRDKAYMADWCTETVHPDTGVPFEGREVPSFKACKSLALSLHAKLPFVRCIGWDLTVDRDGAVHVLEWNGGHNDIKFCEAVQGPCFADQGWETWPRRRDAGGLRLMHV